MISPRFGVMVSVLLAVALIPTIIHGFVGARTDDGRVTSAIGTTLAGLASKPTERRARWVKEVYGSDDWIERRYQGPDGRDIRLFAARSYDLKRLYHHPELGVVRGTDLKRAVTVPLADLDGAPVHVLTAQRGTGVAVYGLLYDDQFVANPITLQLRTSYELLFSAKKPMTLFLVYDRQLPPATPLDGSLAGKMLSEAVRSFLYQAVKVSSVSQPK